MNIDSIISVVPKELLYAAIIAGYALLFKDLPRELLGRGKKEKYGEFRGLTCTECMYAECTDAKALASRDPVPEDDEYFDWIRNFQ